MTQRAQAAIKSPSATTGTLHAQAAIEQPSAAARRLHGQAAIEFLTTYGWAIILMLSVVAVLFSLGILSPNTVAPDTCTFTSGLSCREFLIATNGSLVIDIGQATGKDINITGMACSAQASPALKATSVRVNNGDHHLTCAATCYTETGALPAPGSYYKGKLIIQYTEIPTGMTHRMEGTIAFKVSGSVPAGCT